MFVGGGILFVGIFLVGEGFKWYFCVVGFICGFVGDVGVVCVLLGFGFVC